MAVLLCLFLAACVPGLINRSGNPSSNAKKTAKDELIKPRVAENPAKDREKISEIEPPKPEASSPPTEKIVQQASQRITRASEEPDRRETREKSIRGAVVKPGEAEASEPKKEPVKSSSKDPTMPEGPLKKFDHSKYLEQLRSKAMDLVKKEPNCSHAFLCKDSITEDWRLYMYRAAGAHFTTKAVAWDEIDEKFEENEDSDEKRPASQFKEHLRILTVGKECKALKGTIP